MRPNIDITEYAYPLPEDRIAKYPLPKRDASKLLFYERGRIVEKKFCDIASLLPENATMVFNDTKVVPARLHFKKETGAVVEVFCLQPYSPAEYNLSFACTESCEWNCVLGNAKRWKGGSLSLCNSEGDLVVESMSMKAELLVRDGQTARVRFQWQGGLPFSEVLDACGKIPIPPYLRRETEEIDIERYQTLYARFRGSVAAPTAGLHFTQKELGEISARGIDREHVCLHVGAGTFLPVKNNDLSSHKMHREPFALSRNLIDKLRAGGRPIVAVGTTSVRTLESLYYAGVSCIESGSPKEVGQWDPYEREYSYSTEEALEAILRYMDYKSLNEFSLGTKIIIVPGFRFRIVDYLVTNFHQPCSTLMLLVSAFVGGDWRAIYDYALSHDFRFLSYGDSSLLRRKE